MVDTKDLKSLPVRECQFESGRGHHRKNFMNIHFVFDKTKKSQRLKKLILKKHKNSSPSKSKLIVVGGGDGFMLNTLKKYQNLGKPFYGINCGTFGFLMNKYNTKNLLNRIRKSKKVIISPIQINFKTSKNKNKKLIAINEVSLFRQSRQTAYLRLKVGKKVMIKRLIGDGILISTPAGSTAYNLSVHGPILSINSGRLAITPISPFRPRRWKGRVISNKLKINVKNLNWKKRPVAAVADNSEVRNIKWLSVKVSKTIKFKLLYDKDRSLIKKIKLEQLKKDT